MEKQFELPSLKCNSKNQQNSYKKVNKKQLIISCFSDRNLDQNSVRIQEELCSHRIFITGNITGNMLCCFRPVVPGGAGGAMAPPIFGRSVNPISTKGGRLYPPNITGTPGFSDGPDFRYKVQG